MTKGIVIFAHNNPDFDYGSLAFYCAKQAKKHLNVPCCLIGDHGTISWLRSLRGPEVDNVFDNIVEIELPDGIQKRRVMDGANTAHNLPWANNTRSLVYDLTPYEETILIDADYVVLSDYLNNLWSGKDDFMIPDHAVDLNGVSLSGEDFIGDASIRNKWATVVYFRKSKNNEILFNLMQYIKEQWVVYRVLYGIRGSLFRNDHLYAIALHILSGYTGYHDVNLLNRRSLLTALDRDEPLRCRSEDRIFFLLNRSDDPWNYHPAITVDQDIHVMNKFALLRYYESIHAQVQT